MCGYQREPGEEDGEGGEGLYLPHLCGEREAGQGTEGDQ